MDLPVNQPVNQTTVNADGAKKKLPWWGILLIVIGALGLIGVCCLGTIGLGWLGWNSLPATAPKADNVMPTLPAYNSGDSATPAAPADSSSVFESAQACPGESVGCWTSGPDKKAAFSFTCPSGYICDAHVAIDGRTYILLGPLTIDVFSWTARPAPNGEDLLNAGCNQAQHLDKAIGSKEVTVWGHNCPLPQ